MEDKKKPMKATMLGRIWNILSSPQTTVPEEVKPDGTNHNFGKYKTIDFFTDRNKFGRELVLLSELSPTHRSCIYTKADFEFSEGFGIVAGKPQSIIKNKTKAEQVPVSDEDINAAAKALKDVNLYQESLLEVSRQVRINLNASGNGYVELVYGDMFGEKYFNAYSHDFHKVIFVYPEGESKTASHVYISEDWDEYYIQKKPPAKLPLYPEVEFIDGSFRTVIHVKEYSIGRDFYGLPLFIAAKMSAQLEYESDRHNLERFFSDFMPKFFAAFMAPGGMSDDQKEKFYDDFLNTYTKKGRNGNVQAMVQVFESENLKPYFHEFNNKESDGDFTNLKTGANQTLFTAHRWHPVLAGIPIPGGMNDSKQIQNIFSIYNKMTIQPNQRFDLENFINPIFTLMCNWLNLPCKEHSLTLETGSPISFFDAIDINSIVTVNEGRAYIGEDALSDERGNKTIAEMKQAQKTVEENKAHDRNKHTN